MVYLVAGLVVALLVQNWRFNNTIEQLSMIAAQERRETSDAHEAQIEHLCNRIQIPERTAQVSISNASPPQEPYVDPDYAEELSILGAE